jgi:hypothetical protein
MSELPSGIKDPYYHLSDLANMVRCCRTVLRFLACCLAAIGSRQLVRVGHIDYVGVLFMFDI